MAVYGDAINNTKHFRKQIEKSLQNVTSSASLPSPEQRWRPAVQNGVVLAGFEELVLENYTYLD